MKTYVKVGLWLIVLNEIRGLVTVGVLLYSVGWHNLSSIVLRGLP